MRVAVLQAGYDYAANYFEPYIFPNGHVFDGVEFVRNPSEGRFDGVVVVQSTRPLDQRYDLICPPTRTLCAVVEPPDILTLPDGYTQQFHVVVGPDSRVASKRTLLSAAGHHWFVELTAEQATSAPIVDKPRLVSAVVSSKQDTPGHRSRFALMRRLKEHFGDELDWFGRGVRPTGDNKLTALADYKYHIVLENGRWPHYWTEKLADAYMANAFPFYWGAPEIADYFDRHSLELISPDRPEEAIRIIERAIASNAWENRQKQLAEARQRVVTDYHPYRLWHSILKSMPTSEPTAVSIRPFNQFDFSLKQRLRFKMRNLLKAGQAAAGIS
jgi:hypothetical protein